MSDHIDYRLANELDRATLEELFADDALDNRDLIKGLFSRLMTRVEALERAANPACTHPQGFKLQSIGYGSGLEPSTITVMCPYCPETWTGRVNNGVTEADPPAATMAGPASASSRPSGLGDSTPSGESAGGR